MLFEEKLRDERKKDWKEEWEEGWRKILQLLFLDFLQSHGEVPEDIRLRIMNEKNICILMNLTQSAANVKFIEDFKNQFSSVKIDDEGE